MSLDSENLCYLSATEALDHFRSGELSPVELLNAVLDRANNIESVVNPFADKFHDEAIARAKVAESRYLKGTPNKLDGIPLLVKDSSAIKGTRATNGSLLYAKNVDDYTDPSIERLIKAGANFFARSTCPEFCWLFTCHSRLWGVTRNPWRLDITPGGSSGGSAAALAAGATTIATGGDSTGSVRQPAAQCGIVGYKPPYGRNPLDLHSSFDPYVSIGPMTRTVADAALMQNVMSGYHPLDHNSLATDIHIDLLPQRMGNLKIAWSMDMGHYHVSEDVQRETIGVLNALRDAGAEVVEIEMDWASEAIQLANKSQEFMFAGMLEEAIKEHPKELSDYVPQLCETATSVTADDYRRGLDVAGNVWFDHLGPLFETFDALITPGVSYPEVPAENWQKDIIMLNGQEITDTDTAMTVLFNMYNRCPVLSVPAGMTDKGLPVGVQIVGRPYDDVTTFQIGQLVEQYKPWSYEKIHLID